MVHCLKKHRKLFSSGATIHVLTDSEHLVRWAALDIEHERLARWNEVFASHKLVF